MNTACILNAVSYSAIVMPGGWIKKTRKFLLPLLVNDLLHSLVLGRCFMNDLTLTGYKMETAGGTIILTSLRFQSWQYSPEAEHIFIHGFPTSITGKKRI